MGIYYSHMIGIRTGGVFSGDVDWEDIRARIAKIVLEMRPTDDNPDLGDKQGDPRHCLSKELVAHKGSYVILGGVFNYWNWERATVFSKRLSKEFGTEVMHMCWAEDHDEVQCNVFLDGRELFEVSENPIGKVLRRVAG